MPRSSAGGGGVLPARQVTAAPADTISAIPVSTGAERLSPSAVAPTSAPTHLAAAVTPDHPESLARDVLLVYDGAMAGLVASRLVAGRPVSRRPARAAVEGEAPVEVEVEVE